MDAQADHDLSHDQLEELKRRLHGQQILLSAQPEAAELVEDFGEDVVTGESGILANPTAYGMIRCSTTTLRDGLASLMPFMRTALEGSGLGSGCGTYLDREIAKFCPRCGTSLDAKAQAVAAGQAVDCPDCGESVTPGSFCEQCGASLKTDKLKIDEDEDD